MKLVDCLSCSYLMATRKVKPTEQVKQTETVLEMIVLRIENGYIGD